jgi:hypothetical protein
VDNQTTTPKKDEPLTVESYIANAPPEVQGMLKQGMATYNEQKKRLIEVITKNERNSFTEEYLQTKDVEELENIANLAKSDEKEPVQRFNYRGLADTKGTNTVQNEEPLMAPEMDFSKK